MDLAATYTYNAWCQVLGVELTYSYQSNQSLNLKLVELAVLIVLIVASVIGMIHDRRRRHQHETFDSV